MCAKAFAGLKPSTESDRCPDEPHIHRNPPPIARRPAVHIQRPPTRAARRHRNYNRPAQRSHPGHRPGDPLRRHRHIPRQHQHHLRRSINPIRRPSGPSCKDCGSKISTPYLGSISKSYVVVKFSDASPPSRPRHRTYQPHKHHIHHALHAPKPPLRIHPHPRANPTRRYSPTHEILRRAAAHARHDSGFAVEDTHAYPRATSRVRRCFEGIQEESGERGEGVERSRGHGEEGVGVV